MMVIMVVRAGYPSLSDNLVAHSKTVVSTRVKAVLMHKLEK